MRTSLLSRSVIATASLAVASVALAAVPASAGAPSDITRQQVLAAASAVRAEPNPSAIMISPATSRALRVLTNRACSIDPDGDEFAVLSLSEATAGGQSADGVVVTALVVKADIANLITSLSDIEETPDGVDPGDFLRICSFGVLTTTAASSTLAGTATIGGATPAGYSLAGEVFVTPASNFKDFAALIGSGEEAPTELDLSVIAPKLTATGNAVRTFDVSTTKKISTPKSTKQKKAAKKAYNKKLKSAKAAYVKALDKARTTKKKKSAKKAYAAKRASAKAAYKRAVATSRTVTTVTKQSASTPFTVTAQVDLETLMPQVP